MIVKLILCFVFGLITGFSICMIGNLIMLNKSKKRKGDAK